MNVLNCEGKVFLFADMNWCWSKFSQFSRKNGDEWKEKSFEDNFIPVNKNTDPWGYHITQSSIMGMFTSGMSTNFGTWADRWLWSS